MSPPLAISEGAGLAGFTTRECELKGGASHVSDEATRKEVEDAHMPACVIDTFY